MWYAEDKIHVICPKCGQPVALNVGITSIEVYTGELRANLSHASALHKCEVAPS